MKKWKYLIVLFCNKKKVRTLHKCMKKETIFNAWHEYKTQKKPPYIKEYGGKRGRKLDFELGLIFPYNKLAKPVYIRDELGRNITAEMVDKRYRIKELIPYWDEEKVYDYETKKRIRYHELMDVILKIEDIGQIFTLNNKLFLQVEDNVRMFGNKNVSDTERLFEIIKRDLAQRGYGNFIFVKDVSTHQRRLLYRMLEKKGYERSELFRHYSY